MGLFDPEDPGLEKALNKASGYLSHRERSVQEVATYLKKKEFDDSTIQDAIEKLLGWGYLDDRRFAALFIKSRMNSNPKSTYALSCELRTKGIAEPTIQELIAPLDDQELAWDSIQKKIRRWQNLDDETMKKKLMGHLHYRGFNYGTSMATWERLRNTLFDD